MSEARLVEVTPDDRLLFLELGFIRHTRNASRDKLTGNQNYIYEEEQRSWFESLDHDTFKVYIFWLEDVAIGYGIIRLIDEHPWLTGVLHDYYRGTGLGKVLFTQLRDEAIQAFGGPVYLDVFLTNIPAVRTYERLGFEEVSRTENKMVMRYNG